MKRILLISIVCLLFASISFSWPGSKQWQLVWDPNSETDLAGYRVYYQSTDSNWNKDNQSIVVKDVGNVTTYLATGNIPNNSYVRLTAYDLAQNESGFSNTVFFSEDLDVPEIPSGLRKVPVE